MMLPCRSNLPPLRTAGPTAQFEGKSEGEYDQLAGLANNVLGNVGKVGGVVLV